MITMLNASTAAENMPLMSLRDIFPSAPISSINQEESNLQKYNRNTLEEQEVGPTKIPATMAIHQSSLIQILPQTQVELTIYIKTQKPTQVHMETLPSYKNRMWLIPILLATMLMDL